MAFEYTKASLKTHAKSWIEGNGSDADEEFVAALDELLARTHYDGRIPRNMRRQLLEGMGYAQHPGLRDGRVNNNVLPDAGKPRLFLKRTHLAWEMHGASEIARAYTQAQM